MSSCPICNNNELSHGAESCSQCGSDLEIFNYIESAKKERAFQNRSGLVLTALLGIVLVSWGASGLFSGNKEAAVTGSTTDVVAPVQDPLALTASSKPVEEFIQEKEEVKPETTPLAPEVKITPAELVAKAPIKEKVKEKPPVAEAPAENGVIIHKVRRGDSFWTISKKYFGNGNHAKQIAVDNNLKLKKSITVGTKLKINK